MVWRRKTDIAKKKKKYGWKGKERNERKLKKGMKRNVMGREGNE